MLPVLAYHGPDRVLEGGETAAEQALGPRHIQAEALRAGWDEVGDAPRVPARDDPELVRERSYELVLAAHLAGAHVEDAGRADCEKLKNRRGALPHVHAARERVGEPHDLNA